MQARLLNKKYRNSPLGQEYLATLELAATDPETASLRLGALITLYRSLADQEQIGPFIRAAENQLPFIQKQAGERIAIEKQLIAGRLDEARQALATNPQQTKNICQAICLLYRDRPWAASLVRQAEDLLADGDGEDSPHSISSSR